ncbi:unnamed protein product [Arctogadus glacialis]
MRGGPGSLFRIYERLIDPPQTELTAGSGVWLGQHTHKHGLFKGVIQDVKLIFAPNGYISQCPNLNRTCPTCSDFLSLVQGIMDLQEVLAKMTLKLNYAETRLTQLEGCHCERMCSANGLLYRDKELWLEPENCRNCACKNGLMVRVAEPCPELNCTRADQILPDNRCCNVCKGYDFCTEGLVCGENSECRSRSTRAECECRSGFASSHGDSTYCEAHCYELSATSSALRAHCYELSATSSLLRAQRYELIATSSSLRAQRYELIATSSLLRAQRYELSAMSSALRAQRYELSATSSALRAQRYELSATSSALRAHCYEPSATSSALRAQRYKPSSALLLSEEGLIIL